MIKTYIIDKNQTPTAEQIEEVREAAKHPVTFDDDCPELSPAHEKAFKAAAAQRNTRKNA